MMPKSPPSSRMKGVFCYKIMQFELKNIRTTHQRLVSDGFKDLEGTTVEVYVDDVVKKI